MILKKVFEISSSNRMNVIASPSMMRPNELGCSADG
jgi:hypothetical protein